MAPQMLQTHTCQGSGRPVLHTFTRCPSKLIARAFPPQLDLSGADALLKDQQPHFGSRAAGRLLQEAQTSGMLPRQVADLLAQAQQAGQQALTSLQEAASPLTGSPSSPSQLQLPQLPQLPDLPPQLANLRLPQLPTSSFPSQWQASSFSLPPGWQLPKLPSLPSQWQLPQASSLPTQFQLPSAPSLPSQWSLPSLPQLQDLSTPSLPSIPALDGQLERFFGNSPSPHFGTQAALDALQAVISWTSYEILQLESAPQLQQGLQALAAQYSALGEQVQQQLGAVQAGLPGGFGGISTQLPQGPSWQAIAATLQSQAPRTDSAATEARGPPEDVLEWHYDPDFVAAYWQRRPVAVANRTLTVLMRAAVFGRGILWDRFINREAANEPLRAQQLRVVLERLGPAYVKIAQAVSTRVDILSPAYLMEVELLQDRVPPFPTSQAWKDIESAYGKTVRASFATLSPEPVASASLGQVYRGVLIDALGGGEVAVKVQRPRILADVALDLYLMRQAAILSRRLPQVTTDWVGLIDEWAARFFDELDYRTEARNALRFAKHMEGLDGITVSVPREKLTNRTVLTTDWVQGEKLNESTAGDVRQLCTTLLNCYLIQLLESGFLHSDPHPGNLLRTPDGKICILDFGMMTQIEPERSIALVEYIAHLSVKDWTSVAYDLSNLGFVPPGAPDLVESGVVGPLGRILDELSRGGGAKGVNIDQVIVEMDDLTKRFPFQVPSYFALILRAFSVIEGIALRADPQYSIVAETFPYLARRLLTDNSPRTRAALKQLLYGNKARLDVARLQRLAGGLSDFTVSGLTADSQSSGGGQMQTQDVLRLVFNPSGSYIQEVLVEEAVAALDAYGRGALSDSSQAVLGSSAAALAQAGLQALGPLRPFLLPFPTPLELLSRLAPAVTRREEDEEALDVARAVLRMLPDGRLPPPDLQTLAALAQEWGPFLQELLPGIALTGDLFVRAFVRRVALRIAEEASVPSRTIDPETGAVIPSFATSRFGSTTSSDQRRPQQSLGSPFEVLQAALQAFLPEMPVQQRSPGWHASPSKYPIQDDGGRRF